MVHLGSIIQCFYVFLRVYLGLRCQRSREAKIQGQAEKQKAEKRRSKESKKTKKQGNKYQRKQHKTSK